MHESEGKLTRIKQMLDELSAEVNQGKFEATILHDLKLTVDQLRLSLWAIIASRGPDTPQGMGADFGLGTKLAEFRVKRLLDILKELQADLHAGRIPHSNPDLPSLLVALAIALEGATKLLQPARPQD